MRLEMAHGSALNPQVMLVGGLEHEFYDFP